MGVTCSEPLAPSVPADKLTQGALLVNAIQLSLLCIARTGTAMVLLASIAANNFWA